MARGNELSVDITHGERGMRKREERACEEWQGGFQSGGDYRETKKTDKRRQEFPAATPKPTVNQSRPHHPPPPPAAATPSANTPDRFCSVLHPVAHTHTHTRPRLRSAQKCRWTAPNRPQTHPSITAGSADALIRHTGGAVPTLEQRGRLAYLH